MIEFCAGKPELSITLDGAARVTFRAPKCKLSVLSALDDKIYDITIKAHHEKRSLEANAYCWVLISSIAEAVKTDKESVYLQMLKLYGQSEIISVKSNIAVNGYVRYYEECGRSTLNGTEFTHYKIFKGSSEFDKREMSVFIDGIVGEAQSLDIDTRTPEQLAEMKSLWKQGV